MPELKLKLRTAKSAFTRHTNVLKSHLERWKEIPFDKGLEQTIREALVGCREDWEQIMRIYDQMSVSEDMTEQIFLLTFQPKLLESNQRMEDIEVLTSQMIARCQDARDQAAKAEDERTRERGRDPGGGNGIPWRIQKQFKPSKQLDLDFTVTELRAWDRKWDQY